MEGFIDFHFRKTVNNLPKKITIHSFDNKNLIIAPDKPNWIVLSDIGLSILKDLQSGYRLIDALVSISQQYNLDEQLALQEIEQFLNLIVKKRFFEDELTEKGSPDKGAHFHLTNKCNLTCPQCYMDSGKALPNELNLDEWKIIIDDVAAHVANHITLSGGEPLLHPNFLEIIQYIKQKGLTLNLITNGTQFKSFEQTKEIMNFIDDIKISLDGATEEVHDSIRGKGSFKRTLQTFEFLKKLKRSFKVPLVIMPYNADDLIHNLHKLYSDLDYDLIKFEPNPLVFTGRAKDYSRSINQNWTTNTINAISENLSRHGYQNLTIDQARNVAVNNCSFGNLIVITANGNVYACDAFHDCIGNVRSTRLRDLFPQINYLNTMTSVDNIEECKVCDLKYICKGGCKVKHYVANKSYKEVNCNDTFKNHFYKLLVHNEESKSLVNM